MQVAGGTRTWMPPTQTAGVQWWPTRGWQLSKAAGEPQQVKVACLQPCNLNAVPGHARAGLLALAALPCASAQLSPHSATLLPVIRFRRCQTALRHLGEQAFTLARSPVTICSRR